MNIKDGYIVCNNSFKTKFLNECSDKFNNYKFITLSELKNKVLGNVSKEGLLYLSKKESVNSIYNAIEYAKYFYFIDINQEYTGKLLFLKQLKKELIDLNYLTKDDLFIECIKKNNVTFVNTIKTKEITKIIDILSLKNVEFVEDNNYDVSSYTYYKFNTLEEEVNFIFSKINALVRKGISYNDIKICNANDDYEFILSRIKHSLNLPIRFSSESNYLTKESSKLFINLLANFDDFASLFAYLEDKINEKDYLKFLNIVNAYKGVKYKPIELKEVLIYELQKMTFQEDRYLEEINIISIDELEDYASKYVFFLNFNNKLPLICKDDGFLEDKDFDALNIDNSKDKSNNNNNYLINTLKKCTHLIITFSISHPFETVNESLLVNKLSFKNLNSDGKYNIIFGNDEIADKLNLARYYDEYLKFNTKSKFQKYAYNIDYNSYTNIFSGSLKDKITKYFNNGFLLSYTTMDNYFLCPFKFYVAKILNLNEYDDKLSIILGNIAHGILEHCYDKDFDFDKVSKMQIENVLLNSKREVKKLTNKERFFIARILKLTKALIEYNQRLEDSLGLKDKITEHKFSVKFDDKINFTGKIDKVLYDTKTKSYFVIDYKTGSKDAEIINLEDGLSAQLPSYIYLLKNGTCRNNSKLDFKDYKPLGMFLQKVNILQNDLFKDSKFSLQGYLSKEVDTRYLYGDIILNQYYTKDNEPKKIKYKYLLENKDYDYACKCIEDDIKKFEDGVLSGKFAINPVKTSKNDIDACMYCNFKDICYHQEKDIKKVITKSFIESKEDN